MLRRFATGVVVGAAVVAGLVVELAAAAAQGALEAFDHLDRRGD